MVTPDGSQNNAFQIETLSELTDTVNTLFELTMGIFIFSMQMGFALLEAGQVRSKNASSIFIKVCVGFILHRITRHRTCVNV